MGLLDGMTVTVETTLLPDLTFDLGAELAAPQGLATQVAKPKLTVRSQGGSVLYQSMPAGDPASSPPWGTVIVLGVLLLVAVVVTKGGFSS